MIKYDTEEQKFLNTIDGKIATHEEIKDYYDNLIHHPDMWIKANPMIKKSSKQSCTPKEWDTCRVEKMGCRGCYYDVPRTLLINKEKPLNTHFNDFYEALNKPEEEYIPIVIKIY